ncbi:hypothetical protein ACS0TY_026892 [Phlomoides rotata]
MVTVVAGSESRRGRKRKRNNVQNVTVDIDGKKKVVGTRPLKLVGRYVQKDFQGTGVLLGRIMHYDLGSYRVNYENGHCEDLISSKLKAFLVENGNLTGEWLERKEILDELLSGKDVNTEALTVDDTRELENVNPIDSSLLSETTNGDNEVVEVHTERNGDIDADSCGACGSTREGEANVDMEVPLEPPPELPPSSGHIGIPEEYVPDLLSVYSFLRSFSVRLFLYPFGLDDFVGALNCSVANTLLDSVHVALMRVLKRHIERLLSDGSELASKILGCLDWSLFDALTWPIYLVCYLRFMGYNNEDDWQKFYTHCLERDYYTLSVGKKLAVLQILCEEVLGTEELRTEMDMRVESEIGFSTDTSSTVDTMCDPGMVIPGDTENSAFKDREVEGLVEYCEKNSSVHNRLVKSQVDRAVGSSIHEDGNGDECRLCGMDGLLVCCDGCPSASHPRCLGISKMLMPDDSWYCPECKVNASEPKIMQGTTVRGGHIFGVDPYKQVFVASCGHLLVFKASIKSDNGLRYYNRCDIPGVLYALYSRGAHAIMYSEICRRIMEYWEFPPDILPGNKMHEICLQLAIKEGHGQCNTQLVDFPDKVPEMTEVENHESCVNGSSVHMSALKLTSCVQNLDSSENSLNTVTIDDQNIVSVGQHYEIMKSTIIKPAVLSSVIGQPAPCELNKENTSSVAEIVSSRNSDINHGPLNGSSLETKTSIITQDFDNRVDQKSSGGSHDCCLYKGSSFKITGYINHYFHGDFAASAAANLAILSFEENQARESGSSDNHREVLAASLALQIKAFSLAATRFFWPNTEKKLVEVPRERCGWCFSCKAAATSKKGCLLNAAASNAIRWATKVLAGVRPVKNGGDGRLSGIATYLLFMEESLSGLLVGPFLNVMFRKQWRRKVEQATSCNAIKTPLLELEKNIRSIALLGDWMKPVEGFSIQSSTSQTPASAAESTQKHRSGRRGRKHFVMAEVAVKDTLKLNDFTWFRGSTLSELRFQRGIFSSSIIKSSARQGGRKRISGILYHEGSEIPRSNRQHVWRSEVEMSRNVPQLALQVRYLDCHVRWGDLVCPEQTPYDRKVPEAEASAFRNAFICNKKIVESKLRYCVTFDSQKHLPSRVMKNIAEREQILNDGKERFWFSENHVPLYLIKEYEQEMEKNNCVDVLPKLQGRELKASGENIFSFLLWKQEHTDSSCPSCHQDIFYRNAVKCSSCQGFCHKQCASSSTVNLRERIESVITCKQCCESQGATRVGNIRVPPTCPSLLQGRDSPIPVTATKHVNPIGGKGASTSLGPSEDSSEVKSTDLSAVAKKTRKSNWGLIWRKKNCEDTGIDFRLKNVLMRGNVDKGVLNPVCRLCNKPYNADLMYICCETCKTWFHADAVELDESKLFTVVGFRCCRCRRIKSPVCPHVDPLNKTPLENKRKAKITKMNLNYNLISDHHNGSNASNSVRNMQIITRSTKRETNSDGCSANYSFRSEVSNPSELNAVSSVQSVAPKEKIDDGATPTVDHLASDDTRLEHIILSFNELLESDDGGHAKDNEPPEDVAENLKNPSWHDEVKPIISGETGIHSAPCMFCSNVERSPDLCCEVCGMWIHQLCSPWFESSSNPEDGGWRCGGCRDWS